MLKKLMPILLGMAGLGAGLGAGLYLRPENAASENGAADASDHAEMASHDADTTGHEEAAPTEHGGGESGHGGEEGAGGPEYVDMPNQFVIPVLTEGRVSSMVILSLTIEVAPGATEAVYAKEPKLRDAFLQLLFDHANAGGFRGTFTDGANLVLLRRALLEVAQKVGGDVVTDVLISDLARQDT